MPAKKRPLSKRLMRKMSDIEKKLDEIEHAINKKSGDSIEPTDNAVQPTLPERSPDPPYFMENEAFPYTPSFPQNHGLSHYGPPKMEKERSKWSLDSVLEAMNNPKLQRVIQSFLESRQPPAGPDKKKRRAR